VKIPLLLTEPRFVTLGLSNLGSLLVVVYTYREPNAIRVISEGEQAPEGSV
jgi:uncharacterized DUF497 family protein